MNKKVNSEEIESFLEKKNEPDNVSKAFEQILLKVGSHGVYQWKLFVITGFCGLFTGSQNLGAVFLAATPDHWCKIPYFTTHHLKQDKSLLNITVPWIHGKTGLLEPSKCSYYDHDYSMASNQTSDLWKERKCDSWHYDKGQFKSTVVTEWNLVCDRRWLSSCVQASYMMGILVGAVLFSALSDSHGRRFSSLVCCLLFLAASVPAALSPSLASLLALRGVVAAAGQGMYLANYINLMESCGSRGRTLFGSLFGVFFNLGFALLSLLAYVCRDWRTLHAGISLPTVLLLSYFWLLPESPRWLLTHGREARGLRGLRVIARHNGRPFPEQGEVEALLAAVRNEVKYKEHIGMKRKMKSGLHSLTTLFATPNLRRRSLISFYLWFVVSMTSYGLSFSGENLSLSLFVVAVVMSLAGFVGIAGQMALLARFGRRSICSLSFLAGGTFLIGMGLVDRDCVPCTLVLLWCAKVVLNLCFGMAFLLSAELAPTAVRNTAIGGASVCARIGGGLAPFVVDLMGDIYYTIPCTLFGLLSLSAGLLSLLLPETGLSTLPESVQQIERLPR